MIFTTLCRKLGMNPERILPRRLRIREECQLFLAELERLMAREEQPSTRQECPVCGREAVLEARRERLEPRKVSVQLRCTVCPHVVSAPVRGDECRWAHRLLAENLCEARNCPPAAA